MQLIHNTRYLVILIVTLAFMGACTTSNPRTGSANDDKPALDALVTPQWLIEHLDDPDLVVLDCTVLIKSDEKGMRPISGQENYETGHIPSAGFADLMGDLSGPDSRFPMAMPTPEQFSAAMGALGVGNDSRVVLYSANNPDWAARVWWMLRWAGVEQVALLDGGLNAWTTNGGTLSTAPANRPAKKFTATIRPEMIANHEQVFAAIDNSDVSIIDALPLGHYRGEFSMYARPGHILSATSVPSFNLLDEAGQYRSYEELDMLFDGDRNNRVITYCGGGIAAASVAFAMYRLGFTDVAVYMNSLQEWAADPENPMTLDTP